MGSLAMWRPILNPILGLMLLVYILVHLGRTGLYDLPNWINNYLTDFLCMPIILAFCLVGVRKIKRLPKFVLSIWMIYGMTAFYAVLFEYYLPNQSSHRTQDFLDVWMYFLGAGMYQLFLQPKYA